jgi:hypothetical protein
MLKIIHFILKRLQLLEQELKKKSDDLVMEKVKSQEYQNDVFILSLCLYVRKCFLF